MKSILWLYILVLLLTLGHQAHADPFKAAAGGGFGGNLSPLVSDQSTGILGSGVGNQYSVYFSGFRDKPVGLKMRLDMLKMRQESLMKAETEYMFGGTRFRSAEQNYTIWSLNAEKSYEVHGRTWFWEAGLGYAWGRGGNFTIASTGGDWGYAVVPSSVANTWALNLGWGLRTQVFTPGLYGVIEGRTIFFLHTAYNEGPLSSRTLLPIPLMLNFALEYNFDIGN